MSYLKVLHFRKSVRNTLIILQYSYGCDCFDFNNNGEGCVGAKDDFAAYGRIPTP